MRPFDMEVTVVDSARTVWDPEVLAQIARVQEFLERSYGIHHVTSPASLVRAANKAMNGGDSAFHRLPDDAADTRRIAAGLRTFAGAEVLGGLVSPDGRTARVSGRMIDEGGAVHRVKNEALNAFIAQNSDSTVVRFHQTGMAFLIDRNNESLSRQMILSLALSFLLIAAIMTALFRDPRLVLIALVPNVVPMVFIAGLMGLLGIDLKVSTAIIFSNAFGIAVDDTIHLLGKLRIELAKGKSLAYAMKRTYLSGGKAVIVMSLMLCAGFITLIASDFASVYYMGLLISITLAVALLSELFLLPLLVLYFLGKRKVRVIG
ncbi:MAG: MMPL family transporter [Flavobacteriales bacterium]|nr:MMPL family transporter [Flavobacteriales bacterium]